MPILKSPLTALQLIQFNLPANSILQRVAPLLMRKLHTYLSNANGKNISQKMQAHQNTFTEIAAKGSRHGK